MTLCGRTHNVTKEKNIWNWKMKEMWHDRLSGFVVSLTYGVVV